MISITLLLLGATCVYTGWLVFDRDLTAGIACSILGVVFLLRPVTGAVRYVKANFTRGGPPGRRGSGHGAGRRKDHLRLVKSNEDKPTIH